MKVNVQKKNKITEKNKKRVWSLVAIISAIVLVVAGLVTGLVFLLRTPDEKGALLTPELEDFVEDLNNGNKNNYDITEEIVNLPTTVMPEKVIYIDNKYIVAKNGAGADEIYKRTSNGATLIQSFDNNGSPKTYNEYVEISGDYAYIKNGTLAESYIVNLKEEKVVEIIAPEVTDVTFKNGFVFLEFYTHDIQDNEDYLSLKCIHLDSSAICLSVDADDKALACKLNDLSLQVSYNDYSVEFYSYEVQMNSLVKIDEKNFVNFKFVEDDYVALETETLVESEEGKIVIESFSIQVMSAENLTLMKNYNVTKDYTKANYMIEYLNGTKAYFVVSYTKFDVTTGDEVELDYDKDLQFEGKLFNVNSYYGFEAQNFASFDENGNEILSQGSTFSRFAIFNKEFELVLEYKKGQYGDIVYFDGEYLITNGIGSNLLKVDGTKIDVLDSDKYYINTQNVWNNMFVVKGVMGYGISDNKGNVIASPSFEMLSAIIDGHTVGYFDGHYYRIDLINKVATLISNYEIQGDILRALGTGMYVTNVDSKIDVCDFTGKVLYEDIKDLHLIGFENDYSVIKLLVETEEEVVVLKSSVINRALAKSFENGEYNGTAIDDSIEAEERIENLNITNLSTYSKIEVIEEDTNEQNGDNAPNNFTAENTKYTGGGIYYYEDSENLPDSPEDAATFKDFTISFLPSDYVYGPVVDSEVHSSGKNIFRAKNAYTTTRTNKALSLDIINARIDREDYFGLYSDEASLKNTLPPMDYETGLVDNDLEYWGCEGEDFYFKGAKVYVLSDTAIITVSLLEHVYRIEFEQRKGGVMGIGSKYDYTASFSYFYYAFYVTIYMKDHTLVNSLTMASYTDGNNNDNMYYYVNIGGKNAESLDYRPLVELNDYDNDFYTDNSAMVVNGTTSGFAVIDTSETKKSDGDLRVQGGQSIGLADGSIMYGFKTAMKTIIGSAVSGSTIRNITKYDSDYYVDGDVLYYAYESGFNKDTGDTISNPQLIDDGAHSYETDLYHKDLDYIFRLDLRYGMASSVIKSGMYGNTDSETIISGQFYKATVTRSGNNFTLSIIPSVGYKVTWWQLRLTAWKDGILFNYSGNCTWTGQVGEVSVKNDGSVYCEMKDQNADTDSVYGSEPCDRWRYLLVCVQPIVHGMSFNAINDMADEIDESSEMGTNASIYYVAAPCAQYRGNTNAVNNVVNTMLGSGVSGVFDNIVDDPEISPEYNPNSIIYGLGAHGPLSASAFSINVFKNYDGYSLTKNIYNTNERYTLVTDMPMMEQFNGSYIQDKAIGGIYYLRINEDGERYIDERIEHVGLVNDAYLKCNDVVIKYNGFDLFSTLFSNYISINAYPVYVHYTPDVYDISFNLSDLTDVDNKVKIISTDINGNKYCDDISYDYNSALTLEENNLNNILKLYQTSTPNSIQYNSPNTIVGGYAGGGSGTVLPPSITQETKAPDSEDLNNNGYKLSLSFKIYYGETLLHSINRHFRDLYNNSSSDNAYYNFYEHMSLASDLPTFITPVSKVTPDKLRQFLNLGIFGSLELEIDKDTKCTGSCYILVKLNKQSNFFEWDIQLNKNVSDNTRTVFNTPTKDNVKLSGSSVSSSDAGLALTVYTNQNLVRKHGNEIAPKNIFVTQLDAFNYLKYIYKCDGWNVLGADGIAIATMSGTTNFTYSNMKDLFTYMFDGIGAGTNLDTYFNIVFYAQYDEHTPFDYEFKINGESYEFVEENADDENAENSESSEQEEIISNFKYAVADYENMSALTESQYNPYIEQGVMSIEQGKGIIIKFDLNPDYYLGGVQFEKIFGTSRYKYNDVTAYSKEIVNYASSWSIFDDDPELLFSNGLWYKRKSTVSPKQIEGSSDYIITCEETYDSEKGVTIRSYAVILKNIGMGSLTTSGAVGGRISLSIYPREFETDTDNSQGNVQSFTTSSGEQAKIIGTNKVSMPAPSINTEYEFTPVVSNNVIIVNNDQEDDTIEFVEATSANLRTATIPDFSYTNPENVPSNGLTIDATKDSEYLPFDESGIIAYHEGDDIVITAKDLGGLINISGKDVNNLSSYVNNIVYFVQLGSGKYNSYNFIYGIEFVVSLELKIDGNSYEYIISKIEASLKFYSHNDIGREQITSNALNAIKELLKSAYLKLNLDIDVNELFNLKTLYDVEENSTFDSVTFSPFVYEGVNPFTLGENLSSGEANPFKNINNAGRFTFECADDSDNTLLFKGQIEYTLASSNYLWEDADGKPRINITDITLSSPNISMLNSGRGSNSLSVSFKAFKVKSNIWYNANFVTVLSDTIISSYTYHDGEGLQELDTSVSTQYTADDINALSEKASSNGGTISIDNDQDASSLDVRKLTITPNDGYYIHAVVIEYNGLYYTVAHNGNIGIKNGRLSYSLGLNYNFKYTNNSSIVMLGGSNLNFDLFIKTFNTGNGVLELFLAGFMSDAKIHVMFESGFFINIKISTGDNGQTKNSNLLDTNYTYEQLEANKNSLLIFTKHIFDGIYFIDENGNGIGGNFLDTGNIQGLLSVSSKYNWLLFYDMYLTIRIPYAVKVVVQTKVNDNSLIQINEQDFRDNGTAITNTKVLSENLNSAGEYSYTLEEFASKQEDSHELIFSNTLTRFVYTPSTYTSLDVSVYHQRRFVAESYVGTGDGSYRLDYKNDEDEHADNYLYSSQSDGHWSNIEIEYYEGNAYSSTTRIDASDFNNAITANTSFYGSFIKVTIKEINGYYSPSVNLLYGSNSVVWIKNPETINEWVNIGNYGFYKVIEYSIDGNLIVEFKLNNGAYGFNGDGGAELFKIQTYYEANPYKIRYDYYGGLDAENKSSAQWGTYYHNVKPNIQNQPFATTTRTGYTLLGFSQTCYEIETDGIGNIYYLATTGSHGEIGLRQYVYNIVDNTLLSSFLVPYVNGTENPYEYINYFSPTDYDRSSNPYIINKNMDEDAGSDGFTRDGVGEVGIRTLYAIWAANTYTINLNVNTGDLDDTLGIGSSSISNIDDIQLTLVNSKLRFDHRFNINNENMDKSDFSLPIPTRQGYIFEGWASKQFELYYNSAYDELDAYNVRLFNTSNDYTDNWANYLVDENSILNVELWNALQTKDDTSITLYAVWRPIIYTISTNSLAGGYVDNNNEIGYNTLEDLIYNLNDIHNSVGTSPAKISNNNHFKVVYDTVITDLPEVSRVGYDFAGFVAKIDSLENNSTGKTANIKSSDSSKVLIESGTTLNSSLASYLINYTDSSSAIFDGDGAGNGAYINIIPYWGAQSFNVYYSLANHTLRGFGRDDITFKVDGVDYETEITTFKQITFDNNFDLTTIVASNAYDFEAWYAYYNNGEVLDENLEIITSAFENEITADAVFDYYNYTDILKIAYYGDGTLGYQSIEDLISLGGNSEYETKLSNDRKFTVFAMFGPKDYMVDVNNNPNDKLYQIVQGQNESYTLGGFVDMYTKFKQSDDYDYILDKSLDTEYDVTNKFESNFKLIFTPYEGMYLQYININYGESTYVYEFAWDSLNKTVSFVSLKENGEIISQIIGDVTINKSETLKNSYWDNMKLNYINNDYTSSTVASGAEILNTNVIEIEFIFPKCLEGESIITVTPEWEVQTFDIQVTAYLTKPHVDESKDWNHSDYLSSFSRGKITVPYKYNLKTNENSVYLNVSDVQTVSPYNNYSVENLAVTESAIFNRAYTGGYKFLNYFDDFHGYNLNINLEDGMSSSMLSNPYSIYNLEEPYKHYGHCVCDSSASDSHDLYNACSLVQDRESYIYNNDEIYVVYVQSPKHSVTFHFYNSETGRYEEINNEEKYVLGLYDVSQGKYVNPTGGIYDISSGNDKYYYDMNNGYVYRIPSPFSGSWPEGTNFSGYVVSVSLKYLYDPAYNGGHNLEGKFFTRTEDLIVENPYNYDGLTGLYTFDDMFNISTWTSFNSNYLVDYEVNVYAVYDYKNYFAVNDKEDSQTQLDENDGEVFDDDLSDNVVYTYLEPIGKTLHAEIIISLKMVSVSGDIVDMYDINSLQSVILDAKGYAYYKYLIETHNYTRETALETTINCINMGDNVEYNEFHYYDTENTNCYVAYYIVRDIAGVEDSKFIYYITTNIIEVAIDGTISYIENPPTNFPE